MGSIKEYLISVCVAAIVCGILSQLTEQKGSIGPLMKLLCGLFMLITALSPVITLPIHEFQSYFDQLSVEAEYIAGIGENSAKDQMEQILEDRTRAYIVEKAVALGATLDVEVILQDSVPSAVYLSGAISPYTKHLLTEYIENNLGIAAEDLKWIG